MKLKTTLISLFIIIQFTTSHFPNVKSKFRDLKKFLDLKKRIRKVGRFLKDTNLYQLYDNFKKVFDIDWDFDFFDILNSEKPISIKDEKELEKLEKELETLELEEEIEEIEEIEENEAFLR